MSGKNFNLQFRSSSVTTAKVSHIWPKILGQNKNALSVETTIHTKDARIEKQENPNVLIVRDHMLHLTKGVQKTKKKQKKNRHVFRQHVVNHQKPYASTVSQNTLLQPKTMNETYIFTKSEANVVIQIAQPQDCYPNPKHDILDLKSSMCHRVSNAAKTILNVEITGKYLFESIGSLSAPTPPCIVQVHEHQSQPSLQNHSKSIHPARPPRLPLKQSQTSK